MKDYDLAGIKRLILSGLAGGVALLGLGCGNQIDDAVGLPIPDDSRRSQAVGTLAAGDVISVSYPGAPNLDVTQKIRADGKVSLPMVGDISAAGRSLSSFQGDLQRRYRDQLQDPKVTVSVVAAAAAVYISGAVNKPGKIPLDRPMTALEAVMESGGFAPTANPRKASVVRTAKGAHARYNLDLEAALKGTAPAFYLQPYDVIYVGQRTW